VSASAEGDSVVQALVEATTAASPQWLLNERIAEAYVQGSDRLSNLENVAVIAEGSGGQGVGYEGVARVVGVTGLDLNDALLEECFGPVTVVVRYSTEGELLDCIRQLPASLTASIHAAASDSVLARDIAHMLQAATGRLVYNGFPTGVAVSWAQHHGGPWPSTNSTHTSVGASSIRRFLRPFAWQNAPESLLPEELRDGFRRVPRREDGQLRLSVRADV
jgi:NADP-dependent aldehyde dehydrogenase